MTPGPAAPDPAPDSAPDSAPDLAPCLASVVKTRPGSILVAAVLASSMGHFGSTVTALALTVLSGLGMSLVVAPLTAALMSHAGPSQMGAASGINNAMARMATLIGIAQMGRLARAAYADFGASAAGAAQVAATSQAFRGLALAAAVCSALAALIAAASVRQVPSR